MTVLSDKEAWGLCDRCGKHGRLLVQVEIDGEQYDRESAEPCLHPMIRAAEANVLSALAARGGVDVEVVAHEFMVTRGWAADADPAYATMTLADALRLALAQQAAQHEQELASMVEACEATRADYERRLADTAGERERELYARFVCLNNAHAALEVSHKAREAKWRELFSLYDGLLDTEGVSWGQATIGDVQTARRDADKLRRELGVE